MNIKIHIIYLAILLLGLANHTQAQTNLIVKNKSGDATYFELSKIQRITFPNQSLVITNNSTSETTFPLGNVSALLFGNSANVLTQKSNNENSMKIFPNPISKSATCEFSSLKNEEFIFQVMGLDGKIVLTEKVKAETGINQIPIPVSTLHSNIYLLRVQGANQVQTVRFIKQ